ncbi:hypothetical protein K504DRAFT_458757 [Pleomassaria siparia CBS 279.74]|uniref:Uncharacterized protein n=1 Tax=Pleomassaria siparia CBS 279.74 TaxID=1314801 RepID=A0A6G1K3Y8_9PLEO|nr:hypothetical protein K504DRAFT_458757 [Pleomassaria siparia CBS 279.74]
MIREHAVEKEQESEPGSNTEVAEQRGRIRLKRRRKSSHSPISRPHRGFLLCDREQRDQNAVHTSSSYSSLSASPDPTPILKKTRRRSDAEPDHTLRGRARKRSSTRDDEKENRPIPEEDNEAIQHENGKRKRSKPPSRHRSESGTNGEAVVRRQRSLPNLYNEKYHNAFDV